MCSRKCFRMPTLVILGVIFTIVLVFITGITLTNSINISNIVKLREKVASDSAAANSPNAAQTRAALFEQQYSTLQQHHLSRSDLNYITANHPKNLQRFNLPTGPPLSTQQQQQQQQHHQQQQQTSIAAAVAPNKIVIEIGIRNFSTNANRDAGPSPSSSASATVVEQVVAPLSGAIIDGNIESISVPATGELQKHLNDSLATVFGRVAAAAAAAHNAQTNNETSTNSTTLNLMATSSPSLSSLTSTSTKKTTTTTTTSYPLWPLNAISTTLESLTTTLSTTISTTSSTLAINENHESFLNNSANSWLKSTFNVSFPNQLSIEDHNPAMIDFEKRNYVKKVCVRVTLDLIATFKNF
uniref:Uncharacterized protein n=1 Tax=Glossina pallidipes TaxID=7398 RepID=A0A1B0ADQ8_GLOPL